MTPEQAIAWIEEVEALENNAFAAIRPRASMGRPHSWKNQTLRH